MESYSYAEAPTNAERKKLGKNISRPHGVASFKVSKLLLVGLCLAGRFSVWMKCDVGAVIVCETFFTPNGSRKVYNFVNNSSLIVSSLLETLIYFFNVLTFTHPKGNLIQVWTKKNYCLAPASCVLTTMLSRSRSE